eukprot:761061-Hanusia_phi.AAC.8
MASWTASSPGGRADFPLCILRESFDNSSLLNTFGEHGGTAHADTMEELSSSNGSRMVVESFIVTNRTDKIANKAADAAIHRRASRHGVGQLRCPGPTSRTKEEEHAEGDVTC